VSGLGGLLFGVDVGIIASALPYLEATLGSKFNAGQLSFNRRRRSVGQRDCNAVCRSPRGLDWAEISDGAERCVVRCEHSDDRAS